MISNVTSSTAADTTSSAASSSNSNITEVNGIFGEMFIQNLGSSDPTLVGWDFGPNNIQLPPGWTSSDSSAASTDATTSTDTTSTDATVSTAPSPSASTASTTPAATSGSLIPGIADNNPSDVLNAQQVFGSSPWIASAGGTGPSGNFTLNPEYFATQQTAEMVAQMVGGTVVPVNNMAETPGNVFSQNTDNEMVELPDGGMINAGLVAGFFTHGYSLSMVQSMIQNEVTNVEAAEQPAPTTQGVITT